MNFLSLVVKLFRLPTSSKINSFYRNAILLTIVILFSGCANVSTGINKVETLSTPTSSAKLVVMPLDVELSVLTAAGLLEPQAEWTENAIQHIKTHISNQMAQGDVSVEFFEQTDTSVESKLVQLEKLHEVVGSRIMLHQLGVQKLPSKKDQEPDWSLGLDAALIKEKTGADYALFLFVRDSYASAGRAGMMVFVAIASMGNVALSGGQQVGFASLVDLNSGDIVWFNRLVSGSGDLRTEDAAAKSVSALLKGFPAS